MIRCPACGIRLQDGAPGCPTHGAPSARPPEIAGDPAGAALGDGAVAGAMAPPRLAGYVMKGLLGQGGMGAVFEAEPLAGGAPVAVKIARADLPSASRRLRREERALLGIGAPAVPAVFASGDLSDGSAYVVMELVRAPTLAALLTERPGPLPPELFARVAPAILRSIDAAHRKGFIHCDLKPENLFVEPPGPDGETVARLFDFGLARSISAGEPDERTQVATEGTPEYMSPEQCTEGSEIDPRSDIYSLGVILYEMCCGAPPFWGNSAEVQQSHRSSRPPALSRRVDLSPALEEIILRCLAKDPARRFATVQELQRELARALALGRAAGPSAPTALVAQAPALSAQKPKPAAAPRERRALALVFFETKANIAAVREVLTTLGAQLAHTAGAQCAVAFGHEVGDNPTRSAALAAQVFVDREICQRALVDLASVSIQARPDGSRRYQSPIFQRKEQYPTDADPLGVMLSATAAEMLPDLATKAVPTRPSARSVVQRGNLADATVTRVSSVPTLIGRDELLRELLEASRAATSAGLPTITTVIGAPGYGKSHLAAVVGQQLESIIPRVDLLLIRAREVPGGADEQTTREILRRVLGLPAAAPADLGRALLSERLGSERAKEVWAGVAVTMGWVPPQHPDVRALAAAPGALRSATARAAGEALRASSRTRPLAVVIEDAHFADETALDALEYATLEEAGCPLWVCVIGRPSFGGGRTAWASRAGRRQHIDLPPLAGPAALELARRLLSPAENVPASALARLADRTHGIPLLMVELVRGLKRDGLVRKSEKTGSWVLATEELDGLPDLPLVEWLANRETEALPPTLMAHARLASVFGAEFTADELDGVMRILEREGIATETQLDAGVGLQRLTDSGLLVGHRLGRFGFRHALLREAVYQTVPAAQRDQIHRAAFHYYQDAGAQLSEEQRLPCMAVHASLGGLRVEAASINLELAGRAERKHAYLDAEQLYSRTLENINPDDSAGFVRAAQRRGIMRFRLGRPEDGLKDLAAARARVHATNQPDKEAELLLDESMLLDLLNDFPRAALLTEEAAALLPPNPSPLLEARVMCARARALHRQERAAEAAVLFEQGVEVAERLGGDGYETMVQARSLLGWQYAITGRYDDAERTFARNIAICEASGDAYNLTVALQNRGIVSMLNKRPDRLVDDYRRLLSIARELGFALVAMLAQKDLGEVSLMAGSLDEAERESRRAIEVARSVVGDRSRGTMAAELLLARVSVFQGRLDAARALSDSMKERQVQLRAQGLTEGDFGPSEQLLHQMVDLAVAGAERAAWEDLLAQATVVQQPQDAVEMMELWGITALRNGHSEEAGLRLREALALADKSAEVVAARVRQHLALVPAGRLSAAS